MGRTIIEPKVKKERKNAGKKASKTQKEEEANTVGKEESNEDESAADALRRIGIVCTHAASNKVMHRNTRDIAVSNITMTFHGQPMVDDAELTLNYGNRYGFIGRNGCGKSTFLKAIGAKCFPIPDGIEIFHLSEEIEPSEMTAMEAVMEVDEERSKLEKEAEEINDLMGEEAADDDAMERLTQVYERLDELDAASAETRAHKILTGLGFTEHRKKMQTKDFSGGWRMRVALARALFIQPTLLLLDEPTNHLDMEAVVWLEDYLSKWDKILFMVSHSQDFMNSVCTNMVHLQNKSLTYYGGNYDTFINTREEKEEEASSKYKREQEEIAHMRQYIARFGQGNSKMAKQAQSKEKTLEKMMRSGLTKKPEVEKVQDFKFPDPGPLSPPVLQCNDITFGYPGCEILYSGVDFGIDLDSRVALVGPNGAGKSTLLKIMTGELMPVRGAVRPHQHLRISKFNQHFADVLDLTMTPIDYFKKMWDAMTLMDIRAFLGRFGIQGSAQTSIMSHLSDGQKSRIQLAKMAKETPHALFLDEPTNHLDMESIDSLARAINQFPGGMMLVSHDMRLISQVAKEIWMCDNKTVTKFTGEIGDFKMHLKKQMQRGGVMDGGGGSGKSGDTHDYDKMFVPLTPLTALSAGLQDKAASSLKVAPKALDAGNDNLTPAEMAQRKAREEAAAIEKSRKELEAMYERKKAREAIIAAERGESVEAPPPAPSAADESALSVEEMYALKKAKRGPKEASADPTDEELAEMEPKEREKILAKIRRKKEKELAREAAELEAKETEARKVQKEKEFEEARRIAAINDKKREEFYAEKARKDAIEAEKEAKHRQDAAALLLRRKLDLRAQKAAKKLSLEKARAAARDKAEREVRGDVWNQAQQTAFEKALLEVGAEVPMDKGERWTAIAAAVQAACPLPEGEEKTRNQCLSRYSFLKRYVRDQGLCSEKE